MLKKLEDYFWKLAKDREERRLEKRAKKRHLEEEKRRKIEAVRAEIANLKVENRKILDELLEKNPEWKDMYMEEIRDAVKFVEEKKPYRELWEEYCRNDRPIDYLRRSLTAGTSGK